MNSLEKSHPPRNDQSVWVVVGIFLLACGFALAYVVNTSRAQSKELQDAKDLTSDEFKAAKLRFLKANEIIATPVTRQVQACVRRSLETAENEIRYGQLQLPLVREHGESLQRIGVEFILISVAEQNNCLIDPEQEAVFAKVAKKAGQISNPIL